MNVSACYSEPVVYSVEYAEECDYSWSGGISDENAIACGECGGCLGCCSDVTC